MFLRFLIVLFSLPSLSLGEGFSFKKYDIGVGGMAYSVLYKRGIVTYGGSQFLPLYFVERKDLGLLLAGTSLYYSTYFSEQFLFRGRINFNSTPDDPFLVTQEEREARVVRERTSEFDLTIEYQIPGESFVRILLSQDLKAHLGHYFEVRARWGIVDLYRAAGERPLANLGVFSALGYGDHQHNAYLYGPGAGHSSVNNIEYGVSVTSPKVIDAFWPTFRVSRFELVGNDNLKGGYVQEASGWAVEALAAFALF